MKIHHPGNWFEDPTSLATIKYVRPGNYEEFDEIPEEAITHKINRHALNQLISFLFESGRIKPQLSENRTEDTKIIHRLLDVIEKRGNV